MGDGLGEQIRKLRQQAGLTQQVLAQRAGLSVSGVAGVERGRRPRPKTIWAIERALNIAAGTLTGNSEGNLPATTAGGAE